MIQMSAVCKRLTLSTHSCLYSGNTVQNDWKDTFIEKKQKAWQKQTHGLLSRVW